MGSWEKSDRNTHYSPKDNKGRDGAQSSVDIPQGRLIILSSLTDSLIRLLEEFQYQMNLSMNEQGKLKDPHLKEASHAVELLFNVLVYDSSISESMKIHLTKLQVTYMKVAASDLSFYHKNDHPARALLSFLVEEAKSEALSEHAESTFIHAVDQVIKEYDDSQDIFLEVLSDLKNKIGVRSPRIDKCRETKANIGKDIDMIVKAFVHSTLQNHRAAHLSHDLKSFIQGPWQAYMYWLALNEGIHSDVWEKAKNTLNDVIEACDPTRDWLAKEREEVLVSIGEQVDRGFDALKLDAIERSNWMIKILHEFELADNHQADSVVDFRDEQEEIEQADFEPVNLELMKGEEPMIDEFHDSLMEEVSSLEGDIGDEEQVIQKPYDLSMQEISELEEIELTAPSPFGKS